MRNQLNKIIHALVLSEYYTSRETAKIISKKFPKISHTTVTRWIKKYGNLDTLVRKRQGV